MGEISYFLKENPYHFWFFILKYFTVSNPILGQINVNFSENLLKFELLVTKTHFGGGMRAFAENF